MLLCNINAIFNVCSYTIIYIYVKKCICIYTFLYIDINNKKDKLIYCRMCALANSYSSYMSIFSLIRLRIFECAETCFLTRVAMIAVFIGFAVQKELKTSYSKSYNWLNPPVIHWSCLKVLDWVERLTFPRWRSHGSTKFNPFFLPMPKCSLALKLVYKICQIFIYMF